MIFIKKAILNILLFIMILFICLITNLFISSILNLNTKTVPITKYIFAGCYIVVPYVVFSIRLKRKFDQLSILYLVLIGLLSVVIEKLLWISVGYYFYTGSVDGDLVYRPFLDYITDEIIPFFSIEFVIIGGILSLVIFILSYFFISHKNK